MKIILIGYRCTGKTSIGKRLAERLGLPFLDTDELVEKATGKTIKEMIEMDGWAFFRAREKETIRGLTAQGKSVIATGGGAVLDEENAAALKKDGVLIWLVADAETILKRMRADKATAGQRPPLLAGSILQIEPLHLPAGSGCKPEPAGMKREINETLTVRTPVYSGLADFSIDTAALGIDESVEQIMRFLAHN